MVRRLMGSEIERRDGVIVVRSPQVPDFHWGHFLLLEQPPTRTDAQLIEQRFADEFPDARHRAVGVDTVDGTIGHPAVAAALDAVAELSPVMTAEAVPPIEPRRADDEVSVRPLAVDDDREWAALVRLRQATDGDSDSETAYYRTRVSEARAAADAGQGAWWAVFVDGVPRAELGIFSDGSGVARYQHVGTHPDFRRRRFASALVSAAGRWALADLSDVRTLVIVADAASAGAAAYRSVGFTDREWSAQLYRKPPDS